MLDHATRDERRRELNVVYKATLNASANAPGEIMQFWRVGVRLLMGPSSQACLPNGWMKNATSASNLNATRPLWGIFVVLHRRHG